MGNFIGVLGRRVLPKAALRHAHRHGWIDVKLGFALMRDQRVSILAKLAAIATGVALTAVMVAFEVPLESLVGLLLPVIGIFLDIAFDGLEFLIFPIVIGSIVIRWLAPKAVVDSLRSVSA